MFNWDGTDLWIYVDSASNAIKLGPCGNDLSKKQDVNQYKTVKLTGKLTGNTNISFQTATWNGSYSESGWRMIALCGYHVSDGTVGEMFVDVSYQTINVTVTWNPQINADVTIDVWITCAPV